MFKKKLTKVLACGLAAAFAVACLALTACGSSSSSSSSSSSQANYSLKEDGTLTVITSADYEPMEYMDGSNIVGFDPALINEIGKRLGLNVKITSQSFDTLVTAIAGGNTADCAISAISIDDERAKQVDFTDSYYDSNLAIVVMKDSKYKSRKDLNKSSVKIGAQSGSSGESWVKENLKKADYTPFQETPDLLAALRSGKIDVAVYDQPVAEQHVKGEYTDCKILETIATGEQYGIIVNKNNPELTAAINDALKQIEDDGTMDQLIKDNLS